MRTARRLIATALSLALCVAVLAQAGDPVPDAEASARTFIHALLEGDNATLNTLVPSSPALRYGAYPFDGKPTLSPPSVTMGRKRAYIPFQGKVDRPGFPRQGLIQLRYFPESGWQVRHFYWYDRLPGGIVPPTHSDRTGRAEQPAVLAVVEEYLAAWEAGDFIRLDALTYNWVEKSDKQDFEEVTLRSLNLRSVELDNGEVRIDMQAKLKVATGLASIPFQADGFFIAVRENGTWKIQPYSIAMP